MIDSAKIESQIKRWVNQVELSIKDFDEKDRKKVMVKASRILVKGAKRYAPVGTRKHYRYDSKGQITYNPGNLKRSIKRIPLKKSKDVFVGSNFRKVNVRKYGGVGQPTDAYYAAMIFGSSKAFNNRVLAPAASAYASAVFGLAKQGTIDQLKKRATLRGLKTT